MTMVISHRTKAYRGNGPDNFAPLWESEPATSLGQTPRFFWNDDPDWNVEVCRDCNWSTGKQCEACAEIRARVKRGDLDGGNG